MAYGLSIYTESGVARVYKDSWLLRFHSRHTVTVAKNSYKDVYISGFDPSRWGFYLYYTACRSGKPSVTLYEGRVRLSSVEHYSADFEFIIFQA